MHELDGHRGSSRKNQMWAANVHLCRQNPLLGLSKTPVTTFFSRRGLLGFFDVQRKEYEKRGGLRTVKDLRDENREREEAGSEEGEEDRWKRRTLFGRKRKRHFKDSFFYTDRAGGKGYSSYANAIYPRRPYIWPPGRRLYRTLAILSFTTLLFGALVDADWLAYHIEGIYKSNDTSKIGYRTNRHWPPDS